MAAPDWHVGVEIGVIVGIVSFVTILTGRAGHARLVAPVCAAHACGYSLPRFSMFWEV